MTITRIASSVAVALGLVGGGVLVGQARSDPTPVVSAPVTPPTSPSADALVVRAADKAGLLMMCEAGQRDNAANASYRAAAASHPDLSQDIGQDCRLLDATP